MMKRSLIALVLLAAPLTGFSAHDSASSDDTSAAAESPSNSQSKAPATTSTVKRTTTSKSSQSAPQSATQPATQAAPAAQEPVPVAQQSAASAQQPAAQGTAAASQQSAGQGNQTSDRDQLNQALMNNPQPGDPITVRNTPSTTCINGDGNGLHLVAAGPHTSCDFATALFNQQTQGLDATNDNVRDSLQPQLTVHSPATNQDYAMQCETAADKIITCTGGDNATVYMY